MSAGALHGPSSVGDALAIVHTYVRGGSIYSMRLAACTPPARCARLRGAPVTVVGRTFRDAGVPNVGFHAAELSLMKAAAEAGRALPPADVVVLTMGTGPAPKR